MVKMRQTIQKSTAYDDVSEASYRNYLTNDQIQQTKIIRHPESISPSRAQKTVYHEKNAEERKMRSP